MKPNVIRAVLLLLLAPVSLEAQSFCTPITADTLVAPQILGNGTAGSVTTAQIQAALNTGGHILFNVGASPTTITVTSTLQVTKAVVLDGAGVVTLSGGGARRILQIGPQPSPGYSITLQNISFADGSVPAGRGGAIFNQSGGFWQMVNLKIVNASFSQNAAMANGQDDGGGAAYLTGLNQVRIGNSTFTGNSGSNGGAVYSLGSKSVMIVDSTFTGNAATGTGGNPGNGGNAGALGVDGADRQVDVCRTTFSGNTSNAYGAGFFSVMYDATSRTRFEDVTFESNQVLSSDRFAAGAYVQDGPFAFERVSFLRNNAPGYSGLFVTGALASGSIRNSTFFANVARTGLGAAMSIGSNSPVSIVNTTIANNVSTAAFAGGISIGSPNQLRLTNVILANNTGGNRFVNWNIQNAANLDGGGNMQWPQTRPMGGGNETPATPTTTFADPLLAASDGANGGLVRTVALTAPSPARDTGVSTAEVPPTDARGVARVGAPDRGSYEYVLPTISVGDVTRDEGPPGTVDAPFAVTMTPAAVQTVTVQYQTANNTATAPADYVAIPLTTLTFNPGETSKTITVTINGDIDDEPNETFFVNLSNPSGATIADAQGVGTIVDDDPNADLSVTKTDGVESAMPGQVLVYTITVANAGPNIANGVSVSDPIPSGLTGASWTCAGAGGGACGAPSGNGSIAQSVNLPVGGSVVYTLTATVAANPVTVRNTATATVPAGFGDPNPANNSATDDDLLACDAYTSLVADGRTAAGSLANGATGWYTAALHAGSSYSLELVNELGAALPTVTVFAGDDGCSVATPLVPRDTTGLDPRAGAARRLAFTAAGNDLRYRIRVVNGTGGTVPFTVRVSETALFSPAFSTNSTYNTYYSFQNTTAATVTGTLTLRDTTGAIVGTVTLPIPAGRTASTNTVSLAVPRSRTGTAVFSHDGPPGAVNAESDIANFTFTRPYIQPVKFQAVREQR